MQTLRRRVRGIDGVTISVHCHDDLGLVCGKLAGSHRRGRAPGGMHSQRDRRAGREYFIGRTGHGDAGPGGALSV